MYYFDEKYGIPNKKPPEGETIGYYEIGDWLDKHGKGDVLIFTQDILPYTAYDITPFSDDSKLERFIRRGGIVVWLGDAPFAFRLHCYETTERQKLEKIKRMLEKATAHLPVPEMITSKFGIFEKENKLCVNDVIYGYHIDEERVHYSDMMRKHMEFYKLNDICFLSEKQPTETTITGKLLGYNGKFTIRPTKLTTNIEPITRLELYGVCAGKYAGAFAKKLGKGYFLRLYDVPEEVDMEKVNEIVKKIMEA